MPNDNGHNTNGSGNSLVHANGNGHKPTPQSSMSTRCSGTVSRPPSRRSSNSPSTPALVSRRNGHGGKVYEYLEGHVVFEQANRIFGRGAWGYDQLGDAKLRRIETVDPETGEITVSHAYSARVRVIVAGALPRTDTGFHAVAEKTVDGHDTAIKGAVTDAVKRAFRSFGVQFGNGFYGDQQSSRPAPQRIPVQAQANGKSGQTQTQAKSPNESQEQTLRERLMELCVKQGFDEAQVQAAVQKQMGKGIDDLTADELGSLISAAANKLNQMRQAQSQPRA